MARTNPITKNCYFSNYEVMRIINSPRWGGVVIEPIQSLDTLKYYNGTDPIGMTDSVSGNDAEFVDSPCFGGNGAGFYKLNNIDFSGATTWEIILNLDLSGGMINNSAILSINRENLVSGLQIVFISATDQLQIYLMSLALSIGTSSASTVVNYGITKWEIIHNGTNTAWYQDGVLRGSSVGVPNMSAGASAITNLGGLANATAFALKTGHNIHNIEIIMDGVRVHHWSMSEPINTPATHKTFDTYGGNHATLSGGSTAQNAVGGKYDYLQKGWTIGDGTNGAPVGDTIPASSATSGVDAVGNALDVQNDGTKWFRLGSKLKQSTVNAALIAADSQELWYTSGIANEVTDSNLVLFAASYPTIYGATYDTDFIKGITLTQI